MPRAIWKDAISFGLVRSRSRYRLNRPGSVDTFERPLLADSVEKVPSRFLPIKER